MKIIALENKNIIFPLNELFLFSTSKKTSPVRNWWDVSLKKCFFQQRPWSNNNVLDKF